MSLDREVCGDQGAPFRHQGHQGPLHPHQEDQRREPQTDRGGFLHSFGQGERGLACFHTGRGEKICLKKLFFLHIVMLSMNKLISYNNIYFSSVLLTCTYGTVYIA